MPSSTTFDNISVSEQTKALELLPTGDHGASEQRGTSSSQESEPQRGGGSQAPIVSGLCVLYEGGERHPEFLPGIASANKESDSCKAQHAENDHLQSLWNVETRRTLSCRQQGGKQKRRKRGAAPPGLGPTGSNGWTNLRDDRTDSHRCSADRVVGRVSSGLPAGAKAPGSICG